MFEGAHCNFSQSVHFLISDEILIFRHFHIAGTSSSRAIDNETPSRLPSEPDIHVLWLWQWLWVALLNSHGT
jgi:hypothetical protein